VFPVLDPYWHHGSWTDLTPIPVPFLRREDDNVFYASGMTNNHPAIWEPMKPSCIGRRPENRSSLTKRKRESARGQSSSRSGDRGRKSRFSVTMCNRRCLPGTFGFLFQVNSGGWPVSEKRWGPGYPAHRWRPNYGPLKKVRNLIGWLSLQLGGENQPLKER